MACDWQALYDKMTTDLASGNWRMARYVVDGVDTTFRSSDDFLKMLAFVKRQAGLASKRVFGRTYAGQGGRG